MQQATQTQVNAAIQLIKVIGETLKEAGATPSGTLYAALMQYGCTLNQYNQLIDMFKNAGKVKEVSNLLYWID